MTALVRERISMKKNFYSSLKKIIYCLQRSINFRLIDNLEKSYLNNFFIYIKLNFKRHCQQDPKEMETGSRQIMTGPFFSDSSYRAKISVL